MPSTEQISRDSEVIPSPDLKKGRYPDSFDAIGPSLKRLKGLTGERAPVLPHCASAFHGAGLDHRPDHARHAAQAYDPSPTHAATRNASERAMEMIRMPHVPKSWEQQQQEYQRWQLNVQHSSNAPMEHRCHVSTLLTAANELSDLNWMCPPHSTFHAMHGEPSSHHNTPQVTMPYADSYLDSQARKHHQDFCPYPVQSVRDMQRAEHRLSMHPAPACFVDRRYSLPPMSEWQQPSPFPMNRGSHGHHSGYAVTMSRTQGPCRVLPSPMASASDETVLSPHQVFLRFQIEVFQATEVEVSTHTRGRNKPIQLGQVGLRCRYCAHVPLMQRQKGSSYYPATLLGLYQAAQNMSTNHMQCGLCKHMPDAVKQRFVDLIPSKSTNSGCGRSYWSDSARKQFDLIDTDNGIFCR